MSAAVAAAAFGTPSVEVLSAGGSSCVVKWDAGPGACAGVLRLYRVEVVPEAGEIVESYGFDELANSSGRSVEATGLVSSLYPKLAASSRLYLPANSKGVVQISSDAAKGCLVHEGFADYSNLSLKMALRLPNPSQAVTFGLGDIGEDGSTNTVATVVLMREGETTTNTVPLAGFRARSPVVLNTEGANSKRRVIVDEMSFIRGYAAAHTTTGLVSRVEVARSGRRSLGGLDRSSGYLVAIAAVGSGGAEFATGAPVAFTTSDSSGKGLSIRMR